MRLLISTVSAPAIALALAACGGPSEEAEPETAEPETAEAAPESEESAPAEPAPEPSTGPAEADLAVVAEARDCVAPEGESMDAFAPPEREDGENERAYNLRVAEAFMAGNVERSCVFALDSGLQFRIVEAAGEDAASPEYGDLVTVNYEGRLVDGTVFDSSYERGQPATFPSDRLIQGWVQALPLMRVGEEWTLYVPPELAYGVQGTPGGPIGPNQALIFRLELLGLPSATAAPAEPEPEETEGERGERGD
ncbi:hypothetical protein DDZ18_00020 [Marinicauda salina]|uniref:Peptidyl-prolyl cis-trans isomerase n=1 Tax=Marinicauda salina TaxID=2135793 RepID=A0A2U2BVL2_9PROT|nr:FKBP-type peptidyl-prolyl cis-trans isomerase [Marinicauda salina]PWE18042.1 hypothetical protein DDZ18_00020 [Marinicauda salina]